jgi:GT2 family glycosyltransferase
LTSPPVASVVITSRNRKDDLCIAIDSCLAQNVPLEMVIMDDASDDGTFDSLVARFRSERFPQVRLIRSETRVGYIVLRNRAATLVRTNYIVSIDDDAIFSSPRVVEQTIREFSDPRIGAVAIPFQNIRISKRVFQRSPDPGEVYITSEYIGTAHAVRRDLFLQLGGYRESFVHQGEERDYCIRLLDAGYVVRMGSSELIHHFVSPKRDMRRLHYYGTRNNILFVWYNIAGLHRVSYLSHATISTLIHGVRVGAFRIKLRAVYDGFLEGLCKHEDRRPVRPATLRLFRLLRRGPLPLAKIKAQLPPVCLT